MKSKKIEASEFIAVGKRLETVLDAFAAKIANSGLSRAKRDVDEINSDIAVMCIAFSVAASVAKNGGIVAMPDSISPEEFKKEVDQHREKRNKNTVS